MDNWEYKMQEFTGTGDEFREFLSHEREQAWQLGALFPLHWRGDANELVELFTAPVSQVFLMLQRRVPRVRSATPSSLLRF